MSVRGTMRVIGTLALLSVALLAMPGTADAQFIGTFCFQYTAFTDIHVLSVTMNGPSGVLVSGRDPAYAPENVSISGGGVIRGTVVSLNYVEARTTSGRRAIHDVVLSLTSLTGSDWFSWHDPNGLNHTTHLGIPLGAVPCPAEGAVIEGVRTDDR